VVDDALDLFAGLMANRLISPARRASDRKRLAMLPQLEKEVRTGRRFRGRASLARALPAPGQGPAATVPRGDAELVSAMWKRANVLAGLSLTLDAEEHLAQLTREAGRGVAADSRPSGGGWRAEAKVEIIVSESGGRARLSVDKLGAVGELESLIWLRETTEVMLPRIDLPAIGEIRPLLTRRGFVTPTGIRLRTLADVFAQAEGVRLRLDGTEIQVPRPAAHRPGRRRYVSGKKRQNTHKCRVASDSEGRPLWAGTHLPGRQDDQTVLKTEGIEDLIIQFPPGRAAAGLRLPGPGQD
jgi:hypothetical protein